MSEYDMDMRWDVELVTGEFHDVGADRLEVSNGALVFYKDDLVLVAYAAHYWKAVSGQ